MGGLGAIWAKACLPICNRPLVHHHLDLLCEMGVSEVVIVVGYRGNEVMATAMEHSEVARGNLSLTNRRAPINPPACSSSAFARREHLPRLSRARGAHY